MAAAANMAGISDMAAKHASLFAAAPVTSAAMVTTMTNGVTALQQRIPANHSAGSSLQPSLETNHVTEADKAKWLREFDMVDDPIGTIKQGLSHGTITKEQVQIAEQVYPALIQDIRKQALEKVAGKTEKGKKLPYQQKLRISVLFGGKIDKSLDPDFIQTMQAARIPAPPQSRAGKAGKPLSGFSTEIATDYDKREFGKSR
jgi:hypothetical protein